ncbi:MAG TPA: TIM barrel protein [Vicinamibacteria bacterium]|nr:TIM barrel protein [Vicinamibacteria bacterium]
MIRLSFSTLGCPSWPLHRILDSASRLGYDGVELRFVEGDDALWTRPELTGAGLRETLARLGDAGLAVPCVDTRSFFHSPEAALRRTAADEAARSAEVAARLGARGIRVFGDRVQPGADEASTRAWIVEAVGALRDRLRGSGVEVWLETHGDFAPAAATRSLLEGAGSEGLGAVFDPANAFSEFGEEPEAGIAALGPFLRHVHLKDERRPPDGKIPWPPVLLGRGDFPAARVLAALRKQGYDGWVSFEWEKRWHPEIEEPDVALPHFFRWAADELRERRTAERTGAWVLMSGHLRVEVLPSRAMMGVAAARTVAERIHDLLARDGRAAVVFASAPSQNEFLAALRQEPGIDWPKVTAFHLDEYVGISPDHPASFRRFLVDRLFAHVEVAAFHGLDGQAGDLAAECARYAALLRKEAPALAILGVGENGHLAFIDPPVCDYAEPADVRVVELDEPCRRQQVNDGCFPSLDEVPRTALSLTVPFLMRVPRAVAIVPGPAKRTAIQAAIQGPVTAACPASILRRHRDATLFLDEDSAAGLAMPGERTP